MNVLFRCTFCYRYIIITIFYLQIVAAASQEGNVTTPEVSDEIYPSKETPEIKLTTEKVPDLFSSEVSINTGLNVEFITTFHSRYIYTCTIYRFRSRNLSFYFSFSQLLRTVVRLKSQGLKMTLY